MVSTNNYTKGYAEALVLGTPKDQLLRPDEAKVKKGMTREEVAKLEEEVEILETDMKSVERNYGENVFNLTVARGYVKKLMENAKVVRFLNANYGDFLAEFERLAAAEGL
jgi:hypothetical protein